MTMVEVVVSLGILAFIALSVMTMLTTSLHLNKLASERSIATALASERIQQVTSMQYQQLADVKEYLSAEESADDGPPIIFTADYGDISEFPRYKRTLELNYDTPVAGVLTIKATVSWTHIGQGERSHTMVAYLHPGLE
jgi:type II secretory pathway pseudopilin PulG